MAYLNTSVGQSVAPCRTNPAPSSSHFPTPNPPIGFTKMHFVRCDLTNPCFWIVLVSNRRLGVGTGLLFLCASSPNSFSACHGIHTWLASHFNLFHLIGSCVFCWVVVMEPSSQVPKVIFISMTFSISLGTPPLPTPLSLSCIRHCFTCYSFCGSRCLWYISISGSVAAIKEQWSLPAHDPAPVSTAFFSRSYSGQAICCKKNKQRLDGTPRI